MQRQSQLLTHSHTLAGMHSVATAAGVRCLSLLFGWRMSEWTRVAKCPGWFMRLTAPQSHHLRTRISIPISISLLVFPTPRAPSYQLISSLCNGPRKWVKSRSDSLIWHFFGPQPPSGFWFWFSFSSHSHSFLLSPLLLESTDDRVLFVLVFSFIFA